MRLRGEIHDILYEDRPCNEKLDRIEQYLLTTSGKHDYVYNWKEDAFFWFIISGIPFLLGLTIGWFI